MKKTYLITAMILMALISTVSYGVTPGGPLAVEGNRVVNSDGRAVSFAGMSMFWSNDGWGGEDYWNADCIEWLVSDWGVEIIRAAMGVEDYGGYIYDPNHNQGLLETVVDACIDEGIYVIIDWHSHNAEDYEEEAIDFFEEMATTYGGYDNILYEIYNEPLSGCSWPNDIKPYAEAVIAAIRAIDTDNLIIVGSPEWSQRVDLPAASPITGYDNIAYTIHFYPDMGHTSWLRSRCIAAMNSGIALVATEWGPKSDPNHSENTAWREFCEDYSITNTAWAVNDKSEPWSILVANIGMSTGGWDAEDLSARGTYLKGLISNWDSSPVMPELVGWWKLDENTGSTAYDSSDSEEDGTLAGNTAWVNGADGSALVFDGAGDYVDLGNPSVLDFDAGDFSVCAWVKDPAGNNVFGNGGDEAGGVRYALQCGASVSLLVDDNIDKESVSGGTGLNDGQWHHIAGVRSGGTLYVFADGVQVGSQSLPYSPYDLTNTDDHNAYIGALWQHQANVVGDFYTGTVDDVRVYRGALNEGEVSDIMDEFTPPVIYEDDSVGWWKLDETSGTTAVDSSAEENDGTLTGGPTWSSGALDLDGTDDYVNIGNQSCLDFGTGNFSICAWINTTVGGDVFTKGWDGTNGVRYELNISTIIKFEVDDNSSKVRAYGTTTVNDGYWHHVAIVRDGTTLRTYTDGDPEGTNTVSAGYNLAGTSQGSAYIGVIYDNGDSEYNSFFDGLIDDVRVFDYALTEGEVEDVMDVAGH